MYLSKLRIRNFRNYEATSFKFNGSANTIIGENDSGKSNALTAIRILLDEKYYYSSKTLKESDFNRSLDDWKGHWIVISAEFSGMSPEELDKEVVRGLLNEATAEDIKESVGVLNGKISNSDVETGDLHLIIRPNKSIRQQLFENSGNTEKFNQIRESISTDDYEFEYRGKVKSNFSDNDFYNNIVGNFKECTAPSPEDQQSDQNIIGTEINISDVTRFISVVFIDALRDALRTMNTPQNPIRQIVKRNEKKISAENIDTVKSRIKDLNTSITNISQIGDVNKNLNDKLIDILGLIYSPELSLTSNISDEMTSLSRFLNLKTYNEEDLEFLGLGHLNMIFVALKIVEYDTCNKKEVLNIMLLEEPEAHIHHHIQKTLFRNLGIKDGATQVLMTTHSPNIAESSEISTMNIVKSLDSKSISMDPSYKLNEFGKEKLKTKISLVKSIERYLDAKRSPLLFSKGILLVEGDAEEILIPNLFKNRFGISLDEIGIGLVNIGSTSFEYIASLFGNDRIKRRCSIVTDMDKQAIPEYTLDKDGKEVKSKLYKSKAEQKGSDRKDKLLRLFEENEWIGLFFSETTFEFEFAKKEFSLYSEAVANVKDRESLINEWQNVISNGEEIHRNERILKLANDVGKGWLSSIISEQINCSDKTYEIPSYIVEALAFASKESVSEKVLKKIIAHALKLENYSQDSNTFLNQINIKKFPDISLFIKRLQMATEDIDG